MPSACDVGDGMVEDRLVERQRRDRRDVRDQVEHAKDTRSLLVQTHARSAPFLRRWHQTDSQATRPEYGIAYEYVTGRSKPAALSGTRQARGGPMASSRYRLEGGVLVEARYTLQTDDEQARCSRPLLSTKPGVSCWAGRPAARCGQDRTCRGPTTSANWQSGAAIGARRSCDARALRCVSPAGLCHRSVGKGGTGRPAARTWTA